MVKKEQLNSFDKLILLEKKSGLTYNIIYIYIYILYYIHIYIICYIYYYIYIFI